MQNRVMIHTDYISRRKLFKFSGNRIESGIEDHSRIHCDEDVTFVKAISSHIKIQCEKNVTFLSYIDTHTKIISKGIATFKGEICDHVSIECKEIILIPGIKIGFHVKVNGKEIPPTGQDAKASVVGINGNLIGAPYSLNVVSVTGNFSSSSAISKLMIDNNIGNSLPTSSVDEYSEVTKKYIMSIKKPFNSDKAREMKITHQERLEFIPLSICDSITKEIPNVPVLLHDKTYELKTVFGFPNENGTRFNPDTLKEFTLRDIEPDPITNLALISAFEDIRISRISEKLEKQTLDAEHEEYPKPKSLSQ